MSEIPQPNPKESLNEAKIIQFPTGEVRREELRLAAAEQAHQENLNRSAADYDPLMKMIREELIDEKKARIEQLKAQQTETDTTESQIEEEAA